MLEGRIARLYQKDNGYKFPGEMFLSAHRRARRQSYFHSRVTRGRPRFVARKFQARVDKTFPYGYQLRAGLKLHRTVNRLLRLKIKNLLD